MIRHSYRVMLSLKRRFEDVCWKRRHNFIPGKLWSSTFVQRIATHLTQIFFFKSYFSSENSDSCHIFVSGHSRGERVTQAEPHLSSARFIKLHGPGHWIRFAKHKHGHCDNGWNKGSCDLVWPGWKLKRVLFVFPNCCHWTAFLQCKVTHNCCYDPAFLPGNAFAKKKIRRRLLKTST